jgi:hypothetical protein
MSGISRAGAATGARRRFFARLALADADWHDLVSASPYAAGDDWQGGDGLAAATASVVHDHDGAGVQG